MFKQHILLVDDNFICNADIREFLQENGLHVDGVYCASAAFEIIGAHRPLSALVTDIDLGDGPDGFEVARRARAADPDLPVVYISGTAALRHLSEGVDRSEFIAKPFHPRLVLEALRRVIHEEVA